VKPKRLKKNGKADSFDPQVLLDTAGVARKVADFRRGESIYSQDEAAAKASNECRARGMAVSVSGMLICAIALSRGWPIFTTDPDFKNYARVLAIKLHAPRK
jgi:predicted nucleic acid-binding protein